MSGEELDDMSDEELDKVVGNIAVFARVSPSHKLRIIQSLKRMGEIAAMTGDRSQRCTSFEECRYWYCYGNKWYRCCQRFSRYDTFR